MGAANTLDTANARLKHPGCVLVRLQGPVRHTEWERGDGQGIAAGEFLGRGCSLQDVDPVDWVRMRLASGAWFPWFLFGHALVEDGADRSEARCFEECAPAWAV